MSNGSEKNDNESVDSRGDVLASKDASFNSELSEYLLSLKELADETLDARVRFSADCPRRLSEAMRYSLLAPGKRLRPVLAFVASELCDGEREKVLPACVALEAVHAYSLIHDDLPSMDNDDLRRGRPTCHKQFDEATAILAGDALLTFAFEPLARDIESPEIASRCVLTLASAAGATGMVGGQADDVVWASALKSGVGAFDIIGETLAVAASETTRRSEKTVDDPRQFGLSAFLRKIHRRKTGALIVASLKLGALTAGATSEKLDVLASYGRHLGQAFQISDDLLDVLGEETVMGKRVRKDASSGKLTYPALYGLETSRLSLDETAENAKKALVEAGNLFDQDSRAFKALLYVVDYIVRREK